MTNSENIPALLLSRQQIKDKEEIFHSIACCLDNINEVYTDFSTAYQHNNIHALFHLSKEFYTNSMDFVRLSNYLYKNKLIDFSDENLNNIIDNIKGLTNYIEVLKNDRDQWLKESTITEDPSFAKALMNGKECFETLENNIECFLKMVSKEMCVEKNVTEPKAKYYKIT